MRDVHSVFPEISREVMELLSWQGFKNRVEDWSEQIFLERCHVFFWDFLVNWFGSVDVRATRQCYVYIYIY